MDGILTEIVTPVVTVTGTVAVLFINYQVESRRRAKEETKKAELRGEAQEALRNRLDTLDKQSFAICKKLDEAAVNCNGRYNTLKKDIVDLPCKEREERIRATEQDVAVLKSEMNRTD